MILLSLACSPTPPPSPVLPLPLPQLEASPGVSEVDADKLRELLTAKGPSVRVVNFWATWCKPCVAELPVLEEIADRGGVDVVLIATDVPSVGRARVPEFLSKHHIHTPRSGLLVADDAPAVLASVPAWGGQLPHTVVIGADGSTVQTFAGALDATSLEAVLP